MSDPCPSIPQCCDNPFSYKIAGTPYPPVASGAPVVTSATISQGSGMALSYQIVATNNPTSYGASGLPAGLMLNTATGIISGTIIDTDLLTYIIQIGATNAIGTGMGILTINVVQASPVVSNGSLTVGVSLPLSYQIVATNSPTSYGATGLPAGLSLNTSTGLITGTITSTSVTTYTIPISATNIGGTGNGTLIINVLAYYQISFSQVNSNGGFTSIPGAIFQIAIDGGAFQNVIASTNYNILNQVFMKCTIPGFTFTNTRFSNQCLGNITAIGGTPSWLSISNTKVSTIYTNVGGTTTSPLLDVEAVYLALANIFTPPNNTTTNINSVLTLTSQSFYVNRLLLAVDCIVNDGITTFSNIDLEINLFFGP